MTMPQLFIGLWPHKYTKVDFRKYSSIRIAESEKYSICLHKRKYGVKVGICDSTIMSIRKISITKIQQVWEASWPNLYLY